MGKFFVILQQICKINLNFSMANVIKVRKGLDINLKGIASKKTLKLKEPEAYALVPDDFCGVTPKMMVKDGDRVKAGGVLFYDKNHPDVKFVSPVSGVVDRVERGERRKLLSIRVIPDTEQDYEQFGKKKVSNLNAKEVKAALLESGIFAFFRQRPYDIVANPETAPKAIFISAFDSAPLAPDFEYVLKGQEADFQTGLDALAKLTSVYLGISPVQSIPALVSAKNVTVTVFEGPHPAGNVGVQINKVNPINKGETVWTLGAEEVLFVGRLFNKGIVDLRRIICLAGSEVKDPCYYELKAGAQLNVLTEGRVTEGENLRYISGNVLTGRRVSPTCYLGAHDTMVTVIPEGDEVSEFAGWIMPRCNQFSVNRSYFSWILDLFKKRQYTLDARIKGGERHMIMSGEYDRVFPMDIFPEYLLKAIIAFDIDRMEELGIYEVAPEDFALCEFVDSSKVELQQLVRRGLDALRNEME